MALACVPYIVTILQGKTKPAKVTWIIWFTLDGIILTGMYLKGAINYQILVAGIGSGTILCFALKYGILGWTWLDKFCLSTAFAGLAMWYVMGDPIWGIVVSLVAMLVGSLPTFASTWKNPGHEDKLAWSIGFLSSLCTTAAIPYWNLEDFSQPVTFLFIYAVMMYLLYVKTPKPRVS